MACMKCMLAIHRLFYKLESGGSPDEVFDQNALTFFRALVFLRPGTEHHSQNIGKGFQPISEPFILLAYTQCLVQMTVIMKEQGYIEPSHAS